MDHYKEEYKTNTTPFIKTNKGLQHNLTCYVEKNPLGFPFIDDDMLYFAEALQVEKHVSGDDIIQWLIHNKIPTHNVNETFKYLYSRSSTIIDNVKLLENVEFIPIESSKYVS